MRRKSFIFLVWMAGVTALGVLGFDMISKAGASAAYDQMLKDFDSGQTCVMTKPNGQPVFVRKVDIDAQKS